jgi:steroid delta-isomerase-like uncharacterized protein
MSREEINAFFAKRNDAWNRHDVTALTQDHMEEGEVESPLWGHVKGRPSILEIYERWFSSFPDAEFITEDLLIDGDRAVQFGKMIGIHRGTFCGLAATGKRFTMRCAFKFTFEQSKIAHETRVYDFTGLLLQLGVLEAKPAF